VVSSDSSSFNTVLELFFGVFLTDLSSVAFSTSNLSVGSVDSVGLGGFVFFLGVFFTDLSSVVSSISSWSVGLGGFVLFFGVFFIYLRSESELSLVSNWSVDSVVFDRIDFLLAFIFTVSMSNSTAAWTLFIASFLAVLLVNLSRTFDSVIFSDLIFLALLDLTVLEL